MPEEIEGVKFSEFPSATPDNADEVVGLHAGDNARFSVANFILAIRQGLANIFVPKSDVGVANGVAELDGTGKVPSSQLPPFSSDAEDITYDNTSSGLPATNVQDAIDKAVEYATLEFGNIEGVIPSEASTSNKLADKAFVTDSITQGTAIFRGSFATKAALLAVAWQTTNPDAPYFVSNNDYAVVLDDETQNDECWRYIYVTGTGWTSQYKINESPMTQAQLDALNSGATAAIINSVADKLDKTGDGKDVTATFSAASTRANISTGEKLSVLFGKIAKWFSDLGTAAFRAVTGSITSGSTALVESGAVYTGLASKQNKITASGILKGDGAGGVSAATPGTDYGTYSKPSGGIPASDLANGVIPTVPYAYTSNPAMDGTASPGSSGAWAKGDHVHPSDTSKANQAQLATVESGSTASRAYAVGEYFCRNGLLYRVKAAISSGGTFTPGTNCVSGNVMDAWANRHIVCYEGTAPTNTTEYRVGVTGVSAEASILLGISLKHNNNMWYDQTRMASAFSTLPFINGTELRFTFTSSGATNFGGNPYKAYILTI